MKQLGKAAFWMVLIVSAVIFILPFWFMLCNSFEEFSYVLPNPPHLVPTRISFAAYEHVLSQSTLPRAAFNSVVITLVLAFVFLHERFTPKSLIGCLLIGAGTLLMVL